MADGKSSTITFDSSLSGTIPLESEIMITTDLTIQGPGASVITVSGAAVNSGHFLAEENPDVTAKALKDFFTAAP